MTQPWATAHVDAELDWTGIDDALVAKLERSTKIAQRVVDKNLAVIEKKAKARFERMGDAFERQTDRMQRSAAASVVKINSELRGIKSATIGVDVDKAAAKAAQAKIKAAAKAAKATAKVDVDVDEKSARSVAAKVAQAIPDPPAVKVHVEVDDDEAHLQFNAWHKELSEANKRAKIAAPKMEAPKVAEGGGAEASARSLRERITSVLARPFQIRVDEDGTATTSALAKLKAKVDKTRTHFKANPVKLKVDVDNNVLTKGLSKVGSGAMMAAKYGSLAGGAFVALASTGPAIAGLAAALAAVSGAAVAAGVALAAAGGTGIAALKIGISGVGDAFKEMGKDAEGSGTEAADSSRKVTDAQQNLTRAVRDEKDAQKDVTLARRDALEKLRNLNLELRGNALDEKEANLNLKEARRDLAKGGFKDSLELEAAQLRVQRAEQSLAQAQERGRTGQRDANELRKKGVAGADNVVAANKRLQDTTEAVAKAQQALADAMKKDPASGGVDKFGKALAKLSPNARAFVLAVKTISPAWKDLKTSVQDRLFDGLDKQITTLAGVALPKLKTILGDVAGGFNKAGAQVMGFLSTNTGWQTMLTQGGGIMNKLSASMANLVPGVVSIGQAATSSFGGATKTIDEMARTWSEKMAGKLADGSMQRFFDNGFKVVKQLWGGLKQVWSILSGVLKAAGGVGNAFGGLTGGLAKVADWVKSAQGQASLKSFFESARAAMAAILPVVLQVAQVIGTKLAPIVSSLAVKLGPPLKAAVAAIGEGIDNLRPQIDAMGTALAKVIGWITPLIPKLLPMLPALLGLGLGFKGLSKGAGGAMKVAEAFDKKFLGVTKGMSKGAVMVKWVKKAFGGLGKSLGLVKRAFTVLIPAVRAFGASLMANPIGLIIAGVVLLGVALWAFFTKTETGRKWWKKIWAGIKTAAAAVVDWFKDTAWPAIQSFWTKMKDVVGKVVGWVRNHWRLIISIVGGPMGIAVALVTKHWDKIKAAIGVVWGWIKGTLWPGLQNAFRLIGSVAMWLWQNVIVPAWNGIKAAIGIAWGIIKTYFSVMMSVWRGIGTVAMWLWNNVMIPAWNGIKAAIEGAWSVIRGIIGIGIGVFQKVAQVALWLWNNAITPAWDGIKTATSKVWEWIRDRFTNAVDFVKGLGSKIADVARGMWDGVKDALKGVLKMVAKMWNNSIGKLSFTVPQWLSKVPGAGSFAGKTVSMPKMPEEFRRGGHTGAGDANQFAGFVHADEFVLRKWARRKIEKQYPGLLDFANRTGRLPDKKMRGYADGGTVGASALIQFARGVEGKPYDWGGVNWGDCSGAVSALANFAVGRPPFGSRFATATEDAELKSRGFKAGLGPAGSLNIGWYNGGPAGGHTAATLPDGTHFEMGGGRGNGQFGGQAAGADDPQFSDHAHLPPEMLGGVDGGAPTLGGGGGGTPIGSGIGGGGSGGSGGGGGASWGNSGGGSKYNSTQEARKAGVTPVWVENWPSSIGGGGSGTLSPGDTTTTSGGAPTIAPTPAPTPTPASTDDDEKKRAKDDLAAARKDAGVKEDRVKQLRKEGVKGPELDAAIADRDKAWKARDDKAAAVKKLDAPTPSIAPPQPSGTTAPRDPNASDDTAGAMAQTAKHAGVKKPYRNKKGEWVYPDDPAKKLSDVNKPPPGGPQTPAFEIPKFGGSSLSQWTASTAGQYIKPGVDNFISSTGILGKYDPAKHETSIGGHVANVAQAFIGGQLGSALGTFGADVQPPVLDAVGQFQEDNPEAIQQGAKGLNDAAAGLGNVVVNIFGNADGNDVAAKVAAAQRRRMRRYVK